METQTLLGIIVVVLLLGGAILFNMRNNGQNSSEKATEHRASRYQSRFAKPPRSGGPRSGPR